MINKTRLEPISTSAENTTKKRLHGLHRNAPRCESGWAHITLFHSKNILPFIIEFSNEMRKKISKKM